MVQLPEDVHRLPFRTAGKNRLGIPLAVLGNKAAGGAHHRAGAAIVFLQLQKPSLGPLLKEPEEALGPRPPEAVDALVLVPHHKEILPLQPVQNAVLEAGGILGLIHQDVVVPPGGPLPKEGAPFQGGIGEEQHIVKVHQLLLPLAGGVALQQAGQVGNPLRNSLLPAGEAHIDAVANRVGRPAQDLVRGVLPGDFPVHLPQ